MEWDEICRIYMQMKKSGAVVYGAGRNGRLAIDFLERCHIVIKAVADMDKKQIKTYKCLGGWISYLKVIMWYVFVLL